MKLVTLSALISLLCYCSALESPSMWSRIKLFFDAKIAVPVVGDKNDSISSPLADATALIRAEKYLECINVLLKVLEAEPLDQSANLLMGTSFLALERPDLAESFLFTAVRLSNYTDIIAAHNLAESLRLSGDADLGIKVLLKSLGAIGTDSSSGLIEFALGSLYESKSNYTSAQAWYLASAALSPTNIDAWLKASTMLFDSEHQNLQMAESTLIQALQPNPSNAMIIYNLGVVQHASGKLSEAVTLYDEAIRLDPSLDSAVANLATALHAVGRWEEAASTYPQALLKSKGNAILLSNYALLLNSLNRPLAAFEVIEKAISLQPSNSELLQTRTVLFKAITSGRERTRFTQESVTSLVLAGDWDGAVRYLEAAGEPSEGEGGARAWWLFGTGMSHFFKGNFQLAHDLCLRASDELQAGGGEGSHMVFGCLGISSQYLDDKVSAVRNFALAYNLLLQPTYVSAIPHLGFDMTRQVVEYNLVQALHTNQDYDLCIDLSLQIMQLPPVAQGGAAVLTLAFVKWSPENVAKIVEFGEDQARKGLLFLRPGVNLHDEILRVQSLDGLVLNAASFCLIRTANEDTRKANMAALNSLMSGPLSLVQRTDRELQPPSPSTSASGGGVVLITQFYMPQEKESQERIQKALSLNLDNPLVENILLLNEVQYDFSRLDGSEKITQKVIGHRLTLSEAFAAARDLFPGRIVAIANSDIYFDDSLQKVVSSDVLHSKTVMALLKWFPQGDYLSIMLRTDSQDSWIFRSPVSEDVIEQSKFFLGAVKCDNRLASVFESSGYRVINPCFDIHAIEVADAGSARDDVYSAVGSVMGPVADVYLSDSYVL